MAYHTYYNCRKYLHLAILHTDYFQAPHQSGCGQSAVTLKQKQSI